MAKAVVQIAWLVTFQTLTIHRVMLVVLAHTAMKFFKRLMLLVKHVLRVHIRLPKVYLLRPIAFVANQVRSARQLVKPTVMDVKIVH